MKNRLDKELIQKLLSSGMAKGADFCEVYYEYRTQNSLLLQENKIKNSNSHLIEGVGIRILKGEKIGYAFSDIVDEIPLLQAVETAVFIAGGSDSSMQIADMTSPLVTKLDFESPTNCDVERKSELLYRANETARSFNKNISQVTCQFFDELKHVEIANSEGIWAQDEQSVCNFFVRSLANKENVSDVGAAFIGGRYPFDLFDEQTPESAGEKASRQAVIKLDAQAAPAGMLPVVISKGWGGVLIHEAVGHGLEADFNRKKTSLYSGRIGEVVASEKVTIIDDGTIMNGRGTVAIDDEGTPSKRNVLIENGVLKSYMSDRLNSKLMNLTPSGNGRRMSFREFPLPRMTNTFIDKGADDVEGMFKDIKKGVFAAQLGGGQVDITTGNFVFEVSEGYLIEDGEVTKPVKGANLIGNGPNSMKKVVGVSDDLVIESGTGTCGKDGQSVYVGVGQPTIYLSEMTVGGTES